MQEETRQRRSIRLAQYDYRDQGPYFVTICAKDRMPLFGKIVDYEMVRSTAGEIVAEEWYRSAEMRAGLILDTFVVMPNHIHGIVTFGNPDPDIGMDHNRAHGSAPLPGDARPLTRPAQSLGSFVAGYKSATTKRINEQRGTPRVPVWQRNYFEHIVRSEKAMNRLRNYIETNPQRWEFDQENPRPRR